MSESATPITIENDENQANLLATRGADVAHVAQFMTVQAGRSGAIVADRLRERLQSRSRHERTVSVLRRFGGLSPGVKD